MEIKVFSNLFSVIARLTISCFLFILGLSYQLSGQIPLLEDLDHTTPFGNCDLVPTKLNPDYTLTVNNISQQQSLIASYKINWGDGTNEELFLANFPSATHLYQQLGIFNLVFTAMVNGVPINKTYPVSNQSNPSIGLGNNGGSTTGCSPLLLNFTVTGVAENAPGTYYLIDYGDGSPIENRTFEQMVANSSLEHTYIKSSCDAPGIDGQFTLIVEAVNRCTSTPAKLGSIRVFKSPIANFSTVVNGCLNGQISFINQSVSGAGYDCNSGSATYLWDFGDGNPNSTEKNPMHSFTEPGSYHVSLTSSNPQCAPGTTTKRDICINPLPVSSFDLSATDICKGSKVTATNNSTLAANTKCGNLVYKWVIDNYIGSTICLPNAKLWHFDRGNESSLNPVFIFDNAGSYRINLTVTNGCGSITTSKTIKVKQVPTIKINPLDQLCVGQQIFPTAQVDNCFGETVSSYNWQFNRAQSSVSIKAKPDPITYQNAGSYQILLSATNECGVSNALPVTVKVNDLPNPEISGPEIVCANSKGNVYSTLAGMSNYRWTVSSGGVVISGGTSTSNSVTIDWKDSDSQTVSVNYNQSGCDALIPSVLHIKVNPLPVAITGDAVTICSGVPVQIGGASKEGNSYNWVSEPAGFTSIVSAPNVNPLQTTEYFLTETIGSSGCARTNSVKVTMNPLPVPLISGPAAVCLGSTAIVYTSAAGMSNYQWAISTGGTVTAGGSSTSNTITVTWSIAGIQSISLNYTNENGCVGAVPYEFHVSVNTSQIISLVGPKTVCEQATGIVYTALAGMASYDWNISSGGNLISGGDATSNVAEVLWNKSGRQSVSVNYIQPGCQGSPPGVLDVNVNPRTLPIITGAGSVCAGSKNVIYTTESGKTNYKWEIAAGGIITSGAATNEITVDWISFGNQFVRVNYDFNGLCAAIVPTVFNVMVKELQIPTIKGESITCQGTDAVEYMTEPGMSDYLWKVSDGGKISSGNGNNSVFVTWSESGRHSMSVSYSNKSGCSSTDEVQFPVTVNPSPVASVNPTAQVICSGSVTNIKLTPSDGTITYNWSAETISGTVTGSESGSGSTIAQQLINTTTSVGIVRYTIIPSNGICFGVPIIAEVKVRNLSPTIVGLNKICVQTTGVTYTTESGMTDYNWVVSSGGTVRSGVGTNSITVDWNSTGNQTVSINYSNTTGCTGNSAAVYAVKVNPLPTVTIASPKAVCAGSPVTFTTEQGMTDYLWTAEKGTIVSTDNSQSNSVTVLWNESGPKVIAVNYTNSDGCTAIAPLTSEIEVLQVPLPIISGPQTVCLSAGNIKYSTEYGKSDYKWTISPGGRIVSGGTSLSSFAIVVWDREGAQTISVNYSNGECLSTVPVTLPIHVNTSPTFTISVTSGCSPFTATFKNTTPPGADNFTWDFNDGTKYTTTNSNEEVTHIFINGLALAKAFNVKLISSSESGCTLTSEKVVTVEPDYSVGYLVIQKGCSPFEMKFGNAYSGSKSYSWQTIDGRVLSTEISPLLEFQATANKDTTFVVRLIGESMNGCRDTVENRITVLAQPKAGFTLSVNEGCSPLLVKFTNTSSTEAKAYRWDFGNGSGNVTLTNPDYTFIAPSGEEALYNINLFARNESGCIDTFKSVVKLYTTPQPEFSVDPLEQTMPNRKVAVANLTKFGPWNYTWQFGDQTPSLDGNVSGHEYSKAGYYMISLTAKGNNCSSTKKTGVTINDGPPETAFDCETEGCAPFSMKFTNRSVNGFKFSWDFGNGSHSADFEPQVTYYTGGVYNVRLTVYNNLGEMSYAERVITVYDQPTAFFRVSVDRVRIPGNTASFINLSNNAYLMNWDFGDGSTSSDFEPSHQYLKTGFYDVALTVTTPEKCSDKLVLTHGIEIYSDEIRMANAFVPAKEGSNGGHYIEGDPRNHIFHPNLVAGDVVEYQFQIFNRWGNLFFQSNEVERGWDGYYNGKLCPQDVYVWKIRCKFANGEQVTKIGDVTLLQ